MKEPIDGDTDPGSMVRKYIVRGLTMGAVR
jgi:hypothetical protein